MNSIDNFLISSSSSTVNITSISSVVSSNNTTIENRDSKTKKLMSIIHGRIQNRKDLHKRL